jgi:adenylosuccinate synthase
VIRSFPASSTVLARCTPVLEAWPGWQTPTSDARRFADLPIPAQRYVKRLEELLGCPVDIISVGPERDQAIQIRPII